MAMPYRGKVVDTNQFYDCMVPYMQLSGAEPGESTKYVFRGPNGSGYWIPEGWLFDHAEKDESIAHAAIDCGHQIESLKGQVKAKQKIIEEQAGKIRESIFRLNKKMLDHSDKGLVGRVQRAIDRITTLERQRIADSERMGAEMSARRNFVARLRQMFYPGEVIDAGIDEAALKEVERDIRRRVNDMIVVRDSNEAAADEIKATLAELKSTGHKHEGRSLSYLVDIAIDTERERHHESLDRISKALRQPWAGAGGSPHPYRDWCSFLVNVITDHWQPKPDTFTADESPFGVPYPVEATAVFGSPDGTMRVVLHVPVDMSDEASQRLSETAARILGTEPLLLPANMRIDAVSIGDTAEAKLAELAKRVENYQADLERAVERTLERRSRRDFR